MPRRRKGPREKDLTGRFLGGDYDEDRIEQSQRFSARSKHAQQQKILRTAALRSEQEEGSDLADLPVGEVMQVYSLFLEIEHEGIMYLCTVRKTLGKISRTGIVVGDQVRFRPAGRMHESGRPEGVIEQVLPRRSLLTRAQSFKGHNEHPIVANADQMLIVASLLHPRVKWGLVDRMLVAAQAGRLRPVICLNKVDLARGSEGGEQEMRRAEQVLGHYASMGILTLRTSVQERVGLETLRDTLAGMMTVLAGHSGVGKSSLITAVQPGLDIRVGPVSVVTEKGRHTTTSARRYPLPGGGSVIDTPGVKQFGLWGVTAENLDEFFPDVTGGTAPPWRVASYQRIGESL